MRRTSLEVSIAPSLGNMAYEIKAAGKNILWFPFHSPAGFAADPRHLRRALPRSLGQPHRWRCVLGQRPAIPAESRLGQPAPRPPSAPHPRRAQLLAGVDAGVGGCQLRPGCRHQPPGILEASADDGAVPLRPHHHHDLPAGERRTGSGDGARQPFRRAHAGSHRLPPLLPVARFAPRPVEGPPGRARAPGADGRAHPHRRAPAGGVRRPASTARGAARRCVRRPGARAGWARAFLGRRGEASGSP